MNEKYIKPLLLILRHIHLHPVTPQLNVHPRILHVPDAIQRKTRVAPPYTYGSDCDACIFGILSGKGDFTYVIDEARYGEEVQGTEGTVLAVRRRR